MQGCGNVINPSIGIFFLSMVCGNICTSFRTEVTTIAQHQSAHNQSGGTYSSAPEHPTSTLRGGVAIARTVPGGMCCDLPREALPEELFVRPRGEFWQTGP